MGQSLDELAVHHEEVVFASHRAKADAAKVLVGLTLAVAATLVGTALQVPPVSRWDQSACWTLAGALGFAILTVGCDHVAPFDRGVFQDKRLEGADSIALTKFVLDRWTAQSKVNELSLTYVRGATLIQIALAVVTSTLAIVSLVVA